MGVATLRRCLVGRVQSTICVFCFVVESSLLAATMELVREGEPSRPVIGGPRATGRNILTGVLYTSLPNQTCYK